MKTSRLHGVASQHPKSMILFVASPTFSRILIAIVRICSKSQHK